MSPDVQNQLISICGDIIRTEIVQHVTEEKKFYSVIADGTTDVSGTEQLSISIRYLCYDDNQIQIKEDFIGFTPAVDSSAIGVSQCIIDYLRSAGLDLAYLRGKVLPSCFHKDVYLSKPRTRLRWL